MTTDKRKYLTQTQAAQHRATISSLLSNEPGREYSTDEVAHNLGLSARTAGQLLGGMARGGLIAGPHPKGGKKWWAWPIDRVPETPAPAKPSKPAPQGKPPQGKPPKEIELQLNGTLIVVGRNERTGRIRITIEEV